MRLIVRIKYTIELKEIHENKQSDWITVEHDSATGSNSCEHSPNMETISSDGRLYTSLYGVSDPSATLEAGQEL